jgi:hypothetical protein
MVPDPSALSCLTRFTTDIAVDTWDAHFRWRVGDELRDRTIDATWRRVASAVCGVEHRDTGEWQERFVEAFQEWRIVPDARLLRWAGTGCNDFEFDHPAATLNLGIFIAYPRVSAAYFDYRAFRAAAALAVRLLDNAWLTYGNASSLPNVRIGMMGFAEAVAALGRSYFSEQACEFASALGQTLAAACKAASSQLAQERGPYGAVSGTGVPEHYSHSQPYSIRRHPRMTGIQAQPLLALLANQASDALDPFPGSAPPSNPGREARTALDTLDPKPLLLQQIRLRGRMQPWMDAPIDYPLVYGDDRLDPAAETACRLLANQYRLPEPRFRRAGRAG